ncbi:MAG TPA: hypothetical protein VJ124_15490 [Pyrinomonadaceae bacterium]|nr:hypothetical protein [Pyrinomonadaceae bacterium]
MSIFDRIFRVSPSIRAVCLSISFLVLILLVYPFQSETTPEWSLRVLDNTGRSVIGINVTQHWQHYLLESEGHEELQKSDSEGRVTFSRRTIRASIIRRTLAVIGKILSDGKGARLAPRASVVIWGSRDHETNVAIYKPDEPPPAEVVVHRLN